jgi:hypothetical protein
MADVVKAKLVRGKHQVIDRDGSRHMVELGQIVELTPEQAEAFRDKFELVSEAKSEAKSEDAKK